MPLFEPIDGVQSAFFCNSKADVRRIAVLLEQQHYEQPIFDETGIEFVKDPNDPNAIRVNLYSCPAAKKAGISYSIGVCFRNWGLTWGDRMEMRIKNGIKIKKITRR